MVEESCYYFVYCYYLENNANYNCTIIRIQMMKILKRLDFAFAHYFQKVSPEASTVYQNIHQFHRHLSSEQEIQTWLTTFPQPLLGSRTASIRLDRALRNQHTVRCQIQASRAIPMDPRCCDPACPSRVRTFC